MARKEVSDDTEGESDDTIDEIPKGVICSFVADSGVDLSNSFGKVAEGEYWREGDVDEELVDVGFIDDRGRLTETGASVINYSLEEVGGKGYDMLVARMNATRPEEFVRKAEVEAESDPDREYDSGGFVSDDSGFTSSDGGFI